MDKLKEKLKQNLSAGRFQHSLGAEKFAVKLAKKHHAPVAKAALAALLHDCAKKKKGQDPLGHAPASARLARSLFGVTDKEILNAIKKHTTGAPKMSALEKIIYLPDHLEAGRKFNNVAKMRRIAFKDLDQAIIMVASSIIEFLIKQNLTIDPATFKTRNYYLSKPLKKSLSSAL